MRLYAISDLHLDYADNRAALFQLPDCPNDWLALVGDIANTPEGLESALLILEKKFAQLIWVPGNHELWSISPERKLAGCARYASLVDLCRRHGVITPEDAFPIWQGDGGPHLLAPLFLLYDYSFRPDDVPFEQAIGWAAESGVSCVDEALLHPDPYATRSDWCHARCEISEKRLDAAVSAHALPVILIAHYPLKRQLARLPLIPRFSIWCGSRRTEDWHLHYRARVVVSGHLHIPSTRYLDGVRFEEVSLGYPRQWRVRQRMRGWGIADHLRQILPTPERDAGDPLDDLNGTASGLSD